MFTCPACLRTSHHPEDAVQRYCAGCHWWTGDPYQAYIRPDLFSRFGRPTPPPPRGVPTTSRSSVSTMDWTSAISADNMPDGAQIHQVRHGSSVIEVAGRLVEKEQPCTRECGCGEPASVSVLRCPTSGLNLPGERSQVAVVRMCATGCLPTFELEPADAQEREWGWDHDTVV
jgi:hypothetical protein